MLVNVSLEDQRVFPELYLKFASFVFNQVKDDIYKLTLEKKANYEVRKKFLEQMGIIDQKVLMSLDLVNLVNDSVELDFNNGSYFIKLNSTKRVPGTNIKLKQLVRLLEYGSLNLPELQVIRRIFKKYQEEGFSNLYDEFIEEEFSI